MNGLIYEKDRCVDFKNTYGEECTGIIKGRIFCSPWYSSEDLDNAWYEIKDLDGNTYPVKGKNIHGYVKKEDFMKKQGCRAFNWCKPYDVGRYVKFKTKYGVECTGIIKNKSTCDYPCWSKENIANIQYKISDIKGNTYSVTGKDIKGYTKEEEFMGGKGMEQLW